MSHPDNLSHPDNAGDRRPEPGQPSVPGPVSPGPMVEGTAPLPSPPPPAAPEYPLAMEPPEPPTVPIQTGGYHDGRAATPFAAPLPAPLPAPSPGVPGAPPMPGGWRPPPPRPRRTGLVLMSVFAGLLLAIGAAMTYLWLDTDGRLKQTRADLAAETAQVVELTGTATRNEREIDRLSGELDAITADISDLEQERDGIENARRALQDDLDTVGNCLDLLFEFLGHLAEDRTAEANSMIRAVDDACEKADRVIR